MSARCFSSGGRRALSASEAAYVQATRCRNPASVPMDTCAMREAPTSREKMRGGRLNRLHPPAVGRRHPVQEQPRSMRVAAPR
eukprot:6197235-Pleurochrysis_carterae.AAC.6